MKLRQDVLMERGREVTREEIIRMRGRIQKELSRESAGSYDIKLAAGGLEELEFTVQYLQLRHCRDNPSLLLQGTRAAIRRLRSAGILSVEDSRNLCDAYLFFRTAETILRLRSEPVLKEGSDTLRVMSSFMELKKEGLLLETLHKRRKHVSSVWERADG
jgi:glutamate-ammonia-ligase adenylyltransferase